MIADNYTVDAQHYKDPPSTFRGKLRFLGPGFILSASIVGSGELIATTILGAKAGFTLLWIILLSCFAKVAMQLQFGKQAIISGETILHSFNQLPGFKIKKAHWSVWAVITFTILKIIQVGGMLGGAALVLHMLLPVFTVTTWVLVLAVIVAALVYKNYYQLLEKTSLLMLGLFTVLTLVSLVAVQYTSFAFSWLELAEGLHLKLPATMVIYAVGAFGITGVGSDEIISYNYWCLEKGYASYTGRNDNSNEWRLRAKGWIQVMYLDALVAMGIYTLVTAAFYLLGAAILHNRGEIPEGNRLIDALANIFTQTLGKKFEVVFLIGAFFVLFSSVFATLAYWSRLFSDFSGQMGWIDFHNQDQRKKLIRWLSILLPVCWALAYLFISMPVLMIISGGIVGSALLLIIIFATLYFRYRGRSGLKNNLIFDSFLWLSISSILLVAVYGLTQVIRPS